MKRLGALALCLWAGLALAEPAWQVEAGLGQEGMDGGRPPWRQADLALRGPLAGRGTLEVSARRTERFNLHDSELGLRMGRPVDERWSAALAVTGSPTRQLLPGWSAGGEVQRLWGDGWVSVAGLRVARHVAVTATTVSLTQERYFASAPLGEWRAALHASATALSGSGAGRGAGSGSGLRFQLDHQFNPNLRLGILWAAGREWEPVGAGAWTVMRVRSQAATAHWKLAPGWSMLAAWSNTEVRGVYRRSGGRLGVQRDL